MGVCVCARTSVYTYRDTHQRKENGEMEETNI